MKKMMLVGKTGCGKTTLTQAILGEAIAYRKTQAVNYSGALVDTPGEYLENRRLYTALLALSAKCDIVGLVQDATAVNSLYPPKFATMFNKKIVGIITKVDVADCSVGRAEKFLRWAGAEEIVKSSSMENMGIETLRSYLA